jgi:hypothetical protein
MKLKTLFNSHAFFVGLEGIYNSEIITPPIRKMELTKKRYASPPRRIEIWHI